MSDTKQCRLCKEVKPIEEFRFNKGINRRISDCINCVRLYRGSQAWYDMVNNPDKYRAEHPSKAKEFKPPPVVHTDITPMLDDYRLIDDPLVKRIFSSTTQERTKLERELIEQQNKIQSYLNLLQMLRE